MAKIRQILYLVGRNVYCDPVVSFKSKAPHPGYCKPTLKILADIIRGSVCKNLCSKIFAACSTFRSSNFISDVHKGDVHKLILETLEQRQVHTKYSINVYCCYY